MPQNLAIDLPPNDKEFERWCLYLAREKYGPEVFLNQRKKQHGIDIYWSQNGNHMVVQCKLRAIPKPADLICELEKDFLAAYDHYKTGLKQFIFASNISLEQASTQVDRRASGIVESLREALTRLEKMYQVKMDCWHWDSIQKDVADSPWLMARLLEREKGGELICDDFLIEQRKKHENDNRLKQTYYGGKESVQWGGIVQQLDAPRLDYYKAKQAIASSFSGGDAVAALIKGDGGSGKSVFLRRLAHDLCADYCIYWLKNIKDFLDCEWVFDVLKHGNNDASPKYLIFIEDWYRLVESGSQQQEATKLLAKANETSNVRLVIGDRPSKRARRNAYDDYVSHIDIFELSANENLQLLETILSKMPEWQRKADAVQVKNASNASLFQLLFIFQYADDLDGNIADIFMRIFESDCREFLGRPEHFWKGMAKALYFYANVYVDEGFPVSLEFLRELAAYFGDCPVPPRYAKSLQLLSDDSILKKYFGLEIIEPIEGTSSVFRFHHDTMADSGWRKLGSLFDAKYNENMLKAVLEFFHERYFWVVGKVFYNRIMQPGIGGKKAAQTYLNFSHPEKFPSTFRKSLQKYRTEAWAKKVAREFLETEKAPWENYSVFPVCLDLLKNDESSKDLVSKKAREYLETNISWENIETFIFCLELFKYDEIADLVRARAREFVGPDNPWKDYQASIVSRDLLQTNDNDLKKIKAREFLEIAAKPWINYQAFAVCLKVLKTEDIAKKKALEFLKEVSEPWKYYPALAVCLQVLKNEPEGVDTAVNILNKREQFSAKHYWPLLFRSLLALHDKPDHLQLVMLVANEIISQRKSVPYAYEQLLKIPLFDVPQWLQSTEASIRGWNSGNPQRPALDRKNLYSILVGYKGRPELVEAMCLGVIRNWRFELRIQQKYQTYFVRCLSHPAIQRSEELRQEVLAIGEVILSNTTQPPIILREGTRFWLQSIIDNNPFPDWDFVFD